MSMVAGSCLDKQTDSCAKYFLTGKIVHEKSSQINLMFIVLKRCLVGLHAYSLETGPATVPKVSAFRGSTVHHSVLNRTL